MQIMTRRRTLALGLGCAAGIGLSGLLARPAFAQMDGDPYPADGGDIIIRPVQHASLVITTPGSVIYADPVGGAELYAGLPPADLILLTHEHGDHFNPETLSALMGDATRLVTNPAVHGMLPEPLKGRAQALANGDSAAVEEVGIDAIPAYNTTADRTRYHPQGRDNGYVLSVAGKRIYIAGDTEDIPEMRALAGIDIAFVPMNLPFTMDEAQAASGVAAFRPGVVYPYHYRGSDLDRFEALLAAEGTGTQVKRGVWYS